jgi:hypothetical protein
MFIPIDKSQIKSRIKFQISKMATYYFEFKFIAPPDFVGPMPTYYITSDFNSGHWSISNTKPTTIPLGATFTLTNVIGFPSHTEVINYVNAYTGNKATTNGTWWLNEVFKKLCTFKTGGFTNIPIHLPFPFNTVINIPMPTVLIEQTEEIRQKIGQKIEEIEDNIKDLIPGYPDFPDSPGLRDFLIQIKKILSAISGVIILYILYKILKKYL